jgi:hypothetical protein
LDVLKRFCSPKTKDFQDFHQQNPGFLFQKIQFPSRNPRNLQVFGEGHEDGNAL